MYRDLLVHVDGGQEGRLRTQFAVDLATSVGGRLTGLHVTPPADVSPLYKPSRVDKIVAETSSELAADAQAAAIIYHEEAIQRMAGACWFQASGDVARGISDRARFADLVIIGQYEWQGAVERYPLPIAHSVVLCCGRPVLVVPATLRRSKIERIAVAWDGSREAVRAVHDALPLMHLSRSVQIVTMIRPSAADGEIDAKSLSVHLAHHGIKVAADILQIETVDEHDVLQKQIEEGHYDLLVMGGYSHPKWIEFIFGGATRSILLSSQIPVLVSH
jgi:nucleotide-binding universal stress UspA family protein